MDTPYYVTHPLLEDTAVVYAPATEKARTTFLDWLERKDIIPRSSRQYYRKDMVAERLEDPNVPADVILHYDFEDVPAPSRLGSLFGPREEEKMSDEEYNRLHEELVDESEIPREPSSVEPALPEKRGMPIQDVMLGKWGRK